MKIKKKELKQIYKVSAFWKKKIKNSCEQSDSFNYWLFSLLDCFGKLLNALINTLLVKHLTLHSLLSGK